jgi:26S proteasome regulatory subunit N9
MAAADVTESHAILEAQRKAHPELGEMVDELQKYTNMKLYHQLSSTLTKYLKSPAFATTAAGSAAELMAFFTDFIKQFEKHFDKVRWVQLLAIVCKLQTPETALTLIAQYEEAVKDKRDANFMWRALKAGKLTEAGKYDESKDILDTSISDIAAAYEVDALIQSHVHWTHALLWKALGRHSEYYKSSILFLAYTPLADIPEIDRAQLAFDISVAALIAEDEFNFAELLRQELLGALDGSSYVWIKDFVTAFSEGKFALYDSALSTHRAAFDATSELKGAEAITLRAKMSALALMELAFTKPKGQRRLGFSEIAEHCRVSAGDVEHLVMKAMCESLIKGKIDEVNGAVSITWVKPRILDAPRIDMVRERMDEWAQRSEELLRHLEDMTPELRVC